MWRSPSRAFWGLLAGYAALVLAYNVVQPPFEMSDEFAHFRFVRYLITNRQLPVFQPGDRSEYHQPPLYYALSALLAAPFPAGDLADYPNRINPYAGYRSWEPGYDNKNLYLHGPWDAWPFHDTALAVHVARLASLLAGLVTVAGVYQTARRLLDENGALTAAALAAFTPMFVSVSGSVQNDAGAAAVSTLALWLGVWLYQEGLTARRAALWGAVLGLGALTKISSALMVVPAAALILFWGEAQRIPWRRRLGILAVLALSAALVGGWWYIRNLVLYGEPTAVEVNVTTYGDQNFWQGLAWWQGALPYTWTTYWSRIGHGDLVLPAGVYLALAALIALGLLGLLRQLLRPKSIGVTPLTEQRALTTYFLTAILTAFLGLLAYISRSPTGAQGRYLYTVLAAFTPLVVLGWHALLPARWHRGLAWAVSLGMALFAVLVLALYLVPVYSPPAALAQVPAGATPVSANLGGVAEIEGYIVTPASAGPGDRVQVTVYWRPLSQTDQPYSVYLHLLADDDTLLAQRDTYPGLGRNPTTVWEPGRLFADTYQVLIPDNAAGPAHFKLGLWQTTAGDYAFLLGADGQPADSGLTLGALTLTGARP